MVTRILLRGLSFCHDSLTCGNVTKPQVKGGAVKAMKTQLSIWAFLRCFLVSREYICRSMPSRAHAPPPAVRSRFKVMERRGNAFPQPDRQPPPERLTASHSGIRWGWSRMGGKPPIPRVLSSLLPLAVLRHTTGRVGCVPSGGAIAGQVHLGREGIPHAQAERATDGGGKFAQTLGHPSTPRGFFLPFFDRSIYLRKQDETAGRRAKNNY